MTRRKTEHGRGGKRNIRNVPEKTDLDLWTSKVEFEYETDRLKLTKQRKNTDCLRRSAEILQVLTNGKEEFYGLWIKMDNKKCR